MSLEDFQSAWSAAGSPDSQQQEVAVLVRDLEQTERRRRRLLTMFSINTSAALIFTIYAFFTRPEISWTEALPVLALQVFLAGALVMLIRSWQARRRLLGSAMQSVADAARTALGSVLSEIRDVWLMLLFAAVTIPATALIVNQLIGAGKMNTQQAFSFGSVFAAVISINAVVQWRRYQLKLSPRRERLEQIVAELREAA